MARNLAFTLDREPGNHDAANTLIQVKDLAAERMRVTTLGEEKRFNSFFRLANPETIARLRERFSDLPEKPDARTVFVKLRELRNKW
jgi:hydroxyacylglutathione hydrolase